MLVAAFITSASATTTSWTNGGSSFNLTDSSDWSGEFGGAVPNSSQIALFNQSIFSSKLHLQNTDLTVLGIEIGSGAGALTFDSQGNGNAQFINIGSAGILSNSSNSVSFDVSTKVNLKLTANASFTANNGPILINNSGATFTIQSFTLTLDGANTTSTISQPIEGSGNLIKSGTGTWTLSGANTYSGTTTVAQGKLNVTSIVVAGNASNLGNAISAVALGSASTAGTLSYTGSTTTFTRGFTVNSGGGEVDTATSGQTLTIATGNVATSGIFTIGGAGNTTIGSAMTGSGSLVKTGAGALTLTGNNSFTGNVTLNSGTVVVGNGANLAASSTHLTVDGGSLELNNLAQIVASLQLGSGSVTGNLSLSGTGSSWSGGMFSGAGLLDIGSGADLAITGAEIDHDFNGHSITNAGTVNWSAGNLRAGSGSVFTNDATFNDLNANAATVSLPIAFGGSFTFANTGLYSKTGAGTTIIAIPFSNSGTLSISDGTLLFNDTFTSAGGAINLSGGATARFSHTLLLSTTALTGTGTIDASSVTAGDIISLGHSPGTLNFTGDLTLQGTSKLIIELGGTTQGTDYDFLNISGNTLLDGTLQVSFANGFEAAIQPSDTFTVLTSASLTGSFLNVPSNGFRLNTFDGFGSFQVNFTGNAITLSQFALVPEPSSWVLMTLGLAALIIYCSRFLHRRIVSR